MHLGDLVLVLQPQAVSFGVGEGAHVFNEVGGGEDGTAS